MDHAPTDVRFRNAVLGVTVAERRRPVVVWMGFDDSISAKVYDELFGNTTRTVEGALKDTMCFKALLYLTVAKQAGYVYGTLVLMGTREVYSIALDLKTGEYAWVEPDQFDVQIMHEFHEWEVPTESEA